MSLHANKSPDAGTLGTLGVQSVYVSDIDRLSWTRAIPVRFRKDIFFRKYERQFAYPKCSYKSRPNLSPARKISSVSLFPPLWNICSPSRSRSLCRSGTRKSIIGALLNAINGSAGNVISENGNTLGEFSSHSCVNNAVYRADRYRMYSGLYAVKRAESIVINATTVYLSPRSTREWKPRRRLPRPCFLFLPNRRYPYRFRM